VRDQCSRSATSELSYWEISEISTSVVRLPTTQIISGLAHRQPLPRMIRYQLAICVQRSEVKNSREVLSRIMEEKTFFKIGDRIDQLCLVCNEERGHVVVSVSKIGRITRVSCPMCASRVVYRGGTISSASSRIGVPYDRTRTYRKGQTLIHPTFGEGEVTAVIEPQKMDVLFADRLRRLIHAHS